MATMRNLNLWGEKDSVYAVIASSIRTPGRPEIHSQPPFGLAPCCYIMSAMLMPFCRGVHQHWKLAGFLNLPGRFGNCSDLHRAAWNCTEDIMFPPNIVIFRSLCSALLSAMPFRRDEGQYSLKTTSVSTRQIFLGLFL